MQKISISDKFKVKTLCLEYTRNIAPCRRSHLLKYTSFSAVETGNMLSEEVASSLDVKMNNFVRDISLICFLPTKSWHDVCLYFWGFGANIQIGEEANNAELLEFKVRYFLLILTSTPCSRSRSRYFFPLSSNMYFVHWTSLWI